MSTTSLDERRWNDERVRRELVAVSAIKALVSHMSGPLGAPSVIMLPIPGTYPKKLIRVELPA